MLYRDWTSFNGLKTVPPLHPKSLHILHTFSLLLGESHSSRWHPWYWKNGVLLKTHTLTRNLQFQQPVTAAAREPAWWGLRTAAASGLQAPSSALETLPTALKRSTIHLDNCDHLTWSTGFPVMTQGLQSIFIETNFYRFHITVRNSFWLYMHKGSALGFLTLIIKEKLKKKIKKL